MLDGARSVGIPTFENQNGRMMEGSGGASIIDLLARDGKRMSVFRTYVFPYMDRPNLTVLTHALVTRLTFDGERATGVEITYDGKTHRIEVILSLGAIQTPKVLMQSGLGDQVRIAATRNPSRAASARRGTELSGPPRYWLHLGVPKTACATQQRRRGNLLLEEQA